MPYTTKDELEKKYGQDAILKDRLSKLYAVRELYRASVRSQGFEPSNELIGALEFTPPGRLLVERAMKDHEYSEGAAKFSVFLLLYHHELLVDVKNTRIAKVLESLSTDILSRKITYPWLFDHLLYDRAYRGLAQRPKELSIQRTQELMAGTPTGVFQAGNFLVGPFGVIQSEGRRLLMPGLALPLYHCEDKMCGVAHVAELAQTDSKHLHVVNALRATLEDEEGPQSLWHAWIRNTLTDSYWYDDFSLVNLALLLGDAFSEKEMRIIADKIIADGKGTVRGVFPQRFAELFAASSATIVGKLSKPELLQIALIRTDKVIASVVDQLIADQALKIPPTEVRELISVGALRSWTVPLPECSDLGIRVVGLGPTANGLARLKRLILETHKSLDDEGQLAWSLRNTPGSTKGEKLECLLSRELPSKVLRQIVVSNISTLRRALSHLNADHLRLPNSDEEEDHFVQKLLWKLGFDKVDFGSPVKHFWERLAHFEDVVSSAKEGDSSWITAVRSAGVNLFVGLEELLNNSLSFLCWVFLTDPVVDSHVYNAKRGKSLIPKELDGLVETEKGHVTYDPAGKNTLFPLIVGFSALAKRVRQIVAAREGYAKPNLYLAHYEGKSSLQLFPYKHQFYICDATASDVQFLITVCEEITVKFQQSRVFEIRNKLEHDNEELPSSREMIKCAEILREVVNTLQEYGFVPIIFAHKDRHSDAFGRKFVVSRDGMGREIKWEPSPALEAIRSLPALTTPQIIVSKFKVPETNEPLRFAVEEESEYTKMWRDYPKHGAQDAAPMSAQVQEATPPATEAELPGERNGRAATAS